MTYKYPIFTLAVPRGNEARPTGVSLLPQFDSDVCEQQSNIGPGGTLRCNIRPAGQAVAFLDAVRGFLLWLR